MLELASVRRLGAFAFFVEAFEDLVALATAVLFAGAELRLETEVLGLLLRADANVDHADHRRQLRPVVGDEQGASASHADLLRLCAVLQADLDEHVRHDIGVLPNSIDVLIRELIGLVRQQLAPMRNRDWIWPSVAELSAVHSSRAFRTSEPRPSAEIARSSAPTMEPARW
jgi:hypothetical protein